MASPVVMSFAAVESTHEVSEEVAEAWRCPIFGC